MKRVYHSFSSERGNREIHYYLFSLSEIESQIAAYERKYGMPFSQFSLVYDDHDTPDSDEHEDFWDWRILSTELEERRNAADQDKVTT